MAEMTARDKLHLSGLALKNSTNIDIRNSNFGGHTINLRSDAKGHIHVVCAEQGCGYTWQGDEISG